MYRTQSRSGGDNEREGQTGMEEAEASGSEWDAVIVGTGMGGATLGYALAQAGWRVLFCEAGRSSLGDAAALRGVYPETRFASPGAADVEVLRLAGRCAVPIDDVSHPAARRFFPFVGSGTGGSSALYGMVLERFFPADFEPAAYHVGAEGATLPDHWPIRYADLVPYYEAAETLYGVRGAGDALRPDEAHAYVDAPPPWSAAGRELAEMFARRGLHPYRLPLACEYASGCRGCQGFLCAANCKNDSARICLEPALAAGAQLLDECEVVNIEADRERVTAVVCRRRDKKFRIAGRIVALAAGALATPALLLRSGGATWPEGLANGSGLVGRNLMRHYIDLYATFPKMSPAPGGNVKEFGCNDLYLTGNGKFGAIQSFGRMPPGSMIADDLQRDLRDDVHPAAAAAFGFVKPLAAPLFDRLFSRATVLATIMEDLPYAENRVTPARGTGADIAISYRVYPREAARIADLRRRMKTLLRPLRHLLVKQAENNQRIAHACGTCRFGDDPHTSVLDANNRAHDLENLYVVDASFFPSSGGTNPALTIAANALRVATHLTGQAQTGAGS